MHWAPECHRFRDTGLALESSASRRRDTGRKWALECRQDAPFSFPNHSEMTLNHSQEPHRSNIMLLQAVSHSSDDISHSNPSFGGGTGRHWALECHRSGDTDRHWGTAVPQFYRHWSGTGHSVPLWCKTLATEVSTKFRHSRSQFGTVCILGCKSL